MVQSINLKEYFKSITIIFYALLIGQIFFALIILLLHFYSGVFVPDKNLDTIFTIMTAVFTIGGFMASNFIYKLKLNSIRTKDDLDTKLVELRSALIIRWALLEGPCFFAIIAFLLSGKLLLLGFIALLIMNFFTLRPNPEKWIVEMDLDKKDADVLREGINS